MRQPLKPIADTPERGFVIVAVLWILVALSTLAMVFSVYLSNSARALGVTDTGILKDALVSASLELTAYQLLLTDEKSRPAQGSFRFRLDDAEVLVSFTSEAARVDLNKAPKEILANLFEVLGAGQQTAAEIADRIVGWRTPPKENAANEEEALYLASGLTYSPRQGPFAHVNELSLVLGVPPVMVERALPYVTVFSRSKDIDVLIAPPEVIAALPDMTPAALNDFLKQRSSLPRDKDAVAAALGPAKAAATLPQAKSFRVLTTLRFTNGRHASSEAVIALAPNKDKDQSNGNGQNKDNSGGNINSSSSNSSNQNSSNQNSGNNQAKDNNSDNSKKDKGPYSILSWQDDVATGAQSLKRAGG
jgi:general secretion pathway protein K